MTTDVFLDPPSLLCVFFEVDFFAGPFRLFAGLRRRLAGTYSSYSSVAYSSSPSSHSEFGSVESHSESDPLAAYESSSASADSSAQSP